MAVLEDVNGVEVEILVNGVSAPEYVDEEPGIIADGYDEAIPRTFCYVESKDDAAFSIKMTAARDAADGWTNVPPIDSKGFQFDCDIDGQDGVASGVITSRYLSNLITGVMRRSDGQNTIKAFRFASVSTVDDAGKQQVAEDTIKARSLGTIRVRIYRVTYQRDGRTAASSNSWQGSKVSVAEKALKGRALSHGSTLSPAVVDKRKHTYVSCQTVDGIQAPIAIFYFKYRSKEALRQEMITPRSRSASVASDVDKLPEEEVRRLAREYLAQKSNKKRPASVKTEPGQIPRSERPLKVLKTKGGKVTIDLTEDD